LADVVIRHSVIIASNLDLELGWNTARVYRRTFQVLFTANPGIGQSDHERVLFRSLNYVQIPDYAETFLLSFSYI